MGRMLWALGPEGRGINIVEIGESKRTEAKEVEVRRLWSYS